MPRSLFTSGLICFSLLCIPKPAAHTASMAGKVLAFYRTGYGTSETQANWLLSHADARSDDLERPGTTVPDVPAAPYDSSDREVIRRHLRQAHGAGIDALIAPWFGKDDRLEQVFAGVLKEADGNPVKVCLSLEAIPPATGSNAEKVNALESVLSHIASTHAASSGYFAVADVPVIFVSASALDQFDKNIWRPAVIQFRKSHRALLIADSASGSWLDIMDGIHTRDTALLAAGDHDVGRHYATIKETAEARRAISCATVIPGCDANAQGPSSQGIDREDGRLYRRLWALAIRAQPDWVLIDSFNDWTDGSAVEPSVRFGQFYLQITRDYSNAFKRGTLASEFSSGSLTVTSSVALLADLVRRPSGWLFKNLDAREATISLPSEVREASIRPTLNRQSHDTEPLSLVKGPRGLEAEIEPFSDYLITILER